VRIFGNSGDLMDIIIAGARRCGTTSMYNHLGQHPLIRLAGIREHPKREVHFFDRDEHWAEGKFWYKQQFPHAGGITGKVLTVDKSPTYLQVPYVPERVKQICPSVKIIIMLRHPVDRAYSDFIKRTRKGYEKRAWLKALKAEQAGYNPKPSRYWLSPIHLFGYLDRSDYEPQLKRWYRQFNQGSIIVIQYEYWRRNLQKVMAAVFNFVGVKPIEVRHGKVWQKMKYRAMPPHLRVDLTSLFREKMTLTTIPFAVGNYPWWK
jgi:hypothetical protein